MKALIRIGFCWSSLLLGVLFSGCSTIEIVELSDESAQKMQGATLAHSEREYTEMHLMTPADAVPLGLPGGGGAVGGLMTGLLSEDQDAEDLRTLFQQVGITDPNAAFRASLIQLLQEKYGVVCVGSEGVVVSEDEDGVDFEASSTEADLIIDTKVVWSATYLSLSWSRYRFGMWYVVQISDRSGNVVFGETMFWKTPDELGHPKMEEFLTNEEYGVEAQVQASLKAAREHFQDLL